MKYLQASIVPVLLVLVSAQSLPYNPDDYLEVYPDPRDSEVLQGRTPLYFALIQSLGGPFSEFDASGSVAGVKIALDRINNDSSLLPGYTLHYTFANSQCNETISLDVLHSQLFHEPRKLAIIGAGCSIATESTAEVSHYYNITQMSCVSSSPLLSNRIRFRRYFQLLSSARRIALGYYGVIKQYGWQRVALVVQDFGLFTVPMEFLKELLRKDNIEVYPLEFSTDGGIQELLPDPFDENSRIFIFSMYRENALQLVCEAFHQGLFAPRYVIMTIGWYRESWWTEKLEEGSLNCTIEEMERVLSFSLVVSDEIFLDIERDADVVTTPGITVPEFIAEEKALLGQPPLNITASTYSSYCHDNTWILANALNRTIRSLNDTVVNEELAQAFNVTPPFRLEDFTYGSDKLLEIIFQHLHNTSFNGLTGSIRFGNDGIRNISNLIISQFRNVTERGRTFLDRIEIARGSDAGNFTYGPGEDDSTVYGGFIPYDGVATNQTVSVHKAVTSIYTVLACVGIAFAVVCLTFNFTYRTTKLVKLASTKLNYLIGIGAMVLYINTIFFVIPRTSQGMATGLCQLTPWLTAIGYSLCYGTILVKMARVYYIFNNPTTNKKNSIKDGILMLGVASLVAVDLLILVTYTLVEGIRGNLQAKEVPDRLFITEGEDGRTTNNFIYVCNSSAIDIFLGILYGYKMLLQIIALLLAFSIRKVKVKGLNDAKYIGAAIYVTSIVLAVIIVATYTLKVFIDVFAALFCTGFLAGTTVILFLVFVPLMVGLYKDPSGEDIFKNTSITNQSSREMVLSEGDVPSLRRRIKQLEEDVKKKDEIINTVCGGNANTSQTSEPDSPSTPQTLGNGMNKGNVQDAEYMQEV